MGANGAVEGNSIAIPAVGSALFPLGALGPWPYGYYTLLRWVVCISALMVVYRASHVDRPWAVWTFGLVALLFNPLVPIYLSREIWAPIDVAVAILFVVAILSVRERDSRKAKG